MGHYHDLAERTTDPELARLYDMLGDALDRESEAWQLVTTYADTAPEKVNEAIESAVRAGDEREVFWHLMDDYKAARLVELARALQIGQSV